MATTGEMLKIGTLLAASDLDSTTTDQFHFVKRTSSGIELTGANEVAHGVLLNLPDSGEPAELCVLGKVKVKAGGAITAGDWVKSDAAGEVVTASAADRLAGYVLGWACATAADGDLAEIFFCPAASAMTAIETVIAPGALRVGVEYSHLEPVGTDAITLGDGSYVGLVKRIRMTGGSSTPVANLTVNDMYGTQPTTWTFNATGQGLDLVWTSTGWKVDRIIQAGSEALAGASTTVNPLCMTHVWSIDGTDDMVLADGLVPGQIFSVFVDAATNVPAGTVSGVFRTAAGAATGTDLNANAANDYAHCVWDGAAWNPWTLSSITVS